MKTIYICLAASISLSMACNRKGFDSSGIRQTAERSSGDGINSGDQAIAPVDNRSREEILCQEGPKVIGPVANVDFTAQFAMVCNETSTNDFFRELIESAYKGQGEPEVKTVNYSVDENYITKLSFAFAIKAPIEKPTLITDLEVHNVFAEGIRDETSELIVNVASREPFPSRRSIEKVVLEYDLKTAQRAGIHDIRKTEFNTYLLKEKYEDVSVSTENLIDNSSEFYHMANSLTIGMKADDNQTYIIVVNDYIIKNRIDPDRLEKTLISLNKQSASIMHSFIASKVQ